MGTDARAERTSVVWRFLTVPVRGQTYKNLLYLLIALPLGFLYGGLLGFGFIFGIVTLVVGVGVLILLATLGVVRLVAGLERWLANALLRVDLRQPEDLRSADGLWGTFRAIVDAHSTWRGLGFVTMKLWLGVVGIVLLVFLWSAVELATAPLRYPLTVEFGELNGEPITWSIATLSEAALAVPIGIAAALVLLHVANATAYAAERMAGALLESSTHD